ncbi:MAG: hypothetical protein KAQ83_01155, partial [Nanoarchaeota archaeon]|nr:hypothetical protein [Nanoarchaeota archaeon]
MDISNKTLAMFLVAAIVVSIAGTMISLNELAKGPTQITGQAYSDAGTVSVNVGATVSINVATGGAASFTCSPSTTQDYIIDTEGTHNTGAACTVAPGAPMVVENDGNVDADVSVNISDLGEVTKQGGTFLDGPLDDSWLAYKVTNVTGDEGCVGAANTTYTNFTGLTPDVDQICTNLTAIDATDQLEVDFRMLLPQNAISG